MICYSALPEHWVEPFIPYVNQSYGDTFYLFGSDYIWPRKMNEAVKRTVARVGGKVVGEEYTPFGVKDFAATVRKIEQSGAKVLVVPGAVRGVDHREIAAAVRSQAPDLEHVLTVRAEPAAGQRALEQLEDDPTAPLPASPLGPYDVSMVFYTSGTTADRTSQRRAC